MFFDKLHLWNIVEIVSQKNLKLFIGQKSSFLHFLPWFQVKSKGQKPHFWCKLNMDCMIRTSTRHGLIDLHHWIVTLWWKSFYWWKFHVIFLIFLAAVQKTQDGKKYQVAWTEEVKHAKSGDYEVNLYDDNGYSAMKRVLERGDDASSVKPLVTIMVNHPVSWTQCKNSQCGNFRIFLSFIFYVKSILKNLEFSFYSDFTY